MSVKLELQYYCSVFIAKVVAYLVAIFSNGVKSHDYILLLEGSHYVHYNIHLLIIASFASHEDTYVDTGQHFPPFYCCCIQYCHSTLIPCTHC